MATEDILINDGDSFVSLSALAAEQVDAKLPISDDRDPATVKLDSPSANTFTVSTGGVPGLVLTTNLRVGINCESISPSVVSCKRRCFLRKNFFMPVRYAYTWSFVVKFRL